MKFIPVTERLPQQGDLYHVNIRMVDGDVTIFPAAINFYGKEWEMSGDGYEVVEWLDKEVKEDEKIVVGKFSCSEGEPGYGQMKWNMQFKTNKHVHYDKAVELCYLLERYLNDISTPSLPVGELNRMAEEMSLKEYPVKLDTPNTVRSRYLEDYNRTEREIYKEAFIAGYSARTIK